MAKEPGTGWRELIFDVTDLKSTQGVERCVLTIIPYLGNSITHPGVCVLALNISGMSNFQKKGGKEFFLCANARD
jgi:hypothetical protein